jgi:hypothetical protein
MAALFDRVQMTLNKRGSATMKPTSFCDELMMRLASQAFEHSLCLSPEKPFNSHNFSKFFTLKTGSGILAANKRFHGVDYRIKKNGRITSRNFVHPISHCEAVTDGRTDKVWTIASFPMGKCAKKASTKKQEKITRKMR